MYFNFYEANILIQNVSTPSKSNLLATLTIIEENTEEPCLLDALKTLREKLNELTDEEFGRLCLAMRGSEWITTQGFLFSKL